MLHIGGKSFGVLCISGVNIAKNNKIICLKKHSKSIFECTHHKEKFKVIAMLFTVTWSLFYVYIDQNSILYLINMYKHCQSK